MAKKSQINRNAKREKMVAQYASRRAATFSRRACAPSWAKPGM